MCVCARACICVCMCACMHARMCVYYMYMLYRYMYGDAALSKKDRNWKLKITLQVKRLITVWRPCHFKIGMSALLLAKVSPTLARVDSIPCAYDTFVAHIHCTTSISYAYLRVPCTWTNKSNIFNQPTMRRTV